MIVFFIYFNHPHIKINTWKLSPSSLSSSSSFSTSSWNLTFKQVGSGKSSLEELVRKNFNTFIRSADSIEHFSLAFHHVTGDAFGPSVRSVKKHGSRRGSFFGSDAHVNMLQQTVSLLDRVDLNALGDLVIQVKNNTHNSLKRSLFAFIAL